MKKLANENGVITMITLITILFIVSFLITSYILISNKVKTQKEMISETRKIYESTSTMEEIYNSYFNNDNIVPIYTVEQLLMMGKGQQNVNVNGKYYDFNNDENTIYMLMNDLKFSASDYEEYLSSNYWTPIGNNYDIIAGFEGKNHTITVAYDDYTVTYSNDNNYSNVTAWKKTNDGITNGSIVLQVGDKVYYDELSSGEQSYAIDSSQTGTTSFTLATDDMEWRVLGVNDNGQLELISTQPTSSIVALNGEKGYLNAVDTFNDTCNEVYGQGEYADSARSLNVDDVNNITNYNPTQDRIATRNLFYGFRYQYMFPYPLAGGVYSRFSKGDEEIWESWTSTSTETFKVPGEEEISADNWSSTNILELTNTDYFYVVSDYATSKTNDGISVAELLTNGLNNDNNEAYESNITQWLASTSVFAYNINAFFYIRNLSNTQVQHTILWEASGSSSSGVANIRPVVTISSDVYLTLPDSDSVWQMAK